jgi:hypothetical protein
VSYAKRATPEARAAFALQIRPLAEDGCVSLMPQQ